MTYEQELRVFVTHSNDGEKFLPLESAIFVLEKAESQIRVVQAERDSVYATNTRLNKRCQKAESDIAQSRHWQRGQEYGSRFAEAVTDQRDEANALVNKLQRELAEKQGCETPAHWASRLAEAEDAAAKTHDINVALHAHAEALRGDALELRRVGQMVTKKNKELIDRNHHNENEIERLKNQVTGLQEKCTRMQLEFRSSHLRGL